MCVSVCVGVCVCVFAEPRHRASALPERAVAGGQCEVVWSGVLCSDRPAGQSALEPRRTAVATQANV